MAESGIPFNATPFHTIDPATSGLNTYLVANVGLKSSPKWHEIGAAAYRALQDEGKTTWPAPAKLDSAKDIQVPSRDLERTIRCRLIEPSESSKGVYLHMHGGGHVLGHCDWQDQFLTDIAAATSLTILSVEYRLAPEFPFPAGPEDCYDVATYLVDNPSAYGPLQFIGGESAGSTLAAQTALFLLQERPDHELSGVVLNYGLFDLSCLPAASTYTDPLMITSEDVEHYFAAYLPGFSTANRRRPDVSPLYHPLLALPSLKEKTKVRLPPALFMSGTQDLVVDDQVLMSFRWKVAGGETVVKWIEGAPHGFLLFGRERVKVTAVGHDVLIGFVKERL